MTTQAAVLVPPAEKRAEVDAVRVVDDYRAAYEARDVERLLALFADDAEIVLAPGTFCGKAAIRAVLEWDAQVSAVATVRDHGSGVQVVGRAISWERVVSLAHEGIPFEERGVAIVELDEQGLIRSFRSYYDKLAVLDQIAGALPGIQGRVLRRLTGYLVALGRKGLELPPAGRAEGVEQASMGSPAVPGGEGFLR